MEWYKINPGSPYFYADKGTWSFKILETPDGYGFRVAIEEGVNRVINGVEFKTLPEAKAFCQEHLEGLVVKGLLKEVG